jgi:hypothetical protein
MNRKYTWPENLYRGVFMGGVRKMDYKIPQGYEENIATALETE